MAEQNGNVKNGSPVQKSFLTVGPTLHYSHDNVRRFFILAVAAYIVAWLFWSKMTTGSMLIFPHNWASPDGLWNIGKLITSPLSIFEYPEMIFVFGLLMGILAVIPTLVSQLLSFRHSLMFVFISAVMGQPVGFSLALLVSCFGAASRPLRFRSRIIAIALCTAPQVIYWGVFGGIGSNDPLLAGFGYSTWICAWLTGLVIASAILGIGHYTRYKPGLIFAFNTVVLVIAGVLFQTRTGLAELDYQLYIAGNNPEKIPEFYNQNISKQIDDMVNVMLENDSPFGFYPSDRGLLRERLKNDIQNELRWDRWLIGFDEEGKFNYQRKRSWLFEQYDDFVNPKKKWWMPGFVHNRLIGSKHRRQRMPIALYYKGLLNEYQLDIGLIGKKELLVFHTDYPHRTTWSIWFKLYKEYSTSSESIEARWRIAMHLAGEGKFERADELCDISLNMIDKQLQAVRDETVQEDTAYNIFQEPPKTIMTFAKLENLRLRVNNLKALISKDNQKGNKDYLGKYVMLNPYSFDYQQQLEVLSSKVGKRSGLSDNILLSEILLIQDADEKVEELTKLADDYPDTDGGIKALYELTLLKLKMWRETGEDNPELKESRLIDTKQSLTFFISSYPDSYLAREAAKRLNALPALETR